MEVTKVEGFIINENSYGETSKIVNILTKDSKIIGVMVKGAKKINSPIRSVSQKFTYANFYIYYKKDKLSTLISADIINYFSNIKKDIKKISYLNYITELTEQVLKQADDKNIYNIFISAILKIEDGYDPEVIASILELKYLDFLGVAPNLNSCVICGNKNIVTLSSLKGGFLCKNHYDNEYIVSEKTIRLVRVLKYVDINKITKLNLSDKVKKEISDFIEDYYESYTGIFIKSKTFLKSIEKIN